MTPLIFQGGPADGEVRLVKLPMPTSIEFSTDGGQTWHRYKHTESPQMANPSKGTQAGIYHRYKHVGEI